MAQLPEAVNQQPSSGYYVFQVLRVDVKGERKKSTLRDLYVQVEVNEMVQQTKVVDSTSEAWNETFPIRVSPKKSSVTFTLYNRPRFPFPWSSRVGSAKLGLADLRKKCQERKEYGIELLKFKRLKATLTIIMKPSDIEGNANTALCNLLAILDEDGNLALTPRPVAYTEDVVEQLDAFRMNFLDAPLLKDAAKSVPEIDHAIDVLNGLAATYPLLNLGFQMIALVYKIVSQQTKLDQRVAALPERMVIVFVIAQDLKDIRNNDGVALALVYSINQLLDLFIECCIYIRELSTTTFFKRTIHQESQRVRLDKIEQRLSTLQQDVDRAMKVQELLEVRRRAVIKAQKELRQEFVLSETMRRQMEEQSGHHECLPNTRDSYITSAVDWAFKGSGEAVMWLRGIPGSGKSTIAMSIATHDKLLEHIAAHIFFKRDYTSRYAIVEVIACALAYRCPYVAPLMAARLQYPRPTLQSSFQHLILDPLKEAYRLGVLRKPILFILDALDEYGTARSRPPFLQLIVTEFGKLPSAVRVLITSRPEGDIVDNLTNQLHIRTEGLETNTEASIAAVSTYLNVELKALLPHSNITTTTEWQEKIDALAAAANGLFIWAFLAITIVKADSVTRWKRICGLAGASTAGIAQPSLDPLYIKALEVADVEWGEGDTNEYFAKIFAILLSNHGKLTIEFLDSILEFYQGDSVQILLSKLLSFVSYSERNTHVRIHHKTFADFLQSPTRVLNEPWYIDIRQRHHYVAVRCFSIMEELHFNMYGSVTAPDDSEEQLGNIPPHLLHAIIYWTDYLRGTEPSPDLLQLLHHFLSKRLLFWFEVLSHLKEFSRVAPQALLYVTEWTKKHGVKDAEITSFLDDANRIITRFANIMSSNPKLIYVTVLPLTTRNSRVSSQYSDLAKGVIHVSRIAPDFDVQEREQIVGGDPFLGHFKSVRSVIYTPDMRYIVSGSDDGTVRIWVANTGEAFAAPLRTGQDGAIKTISVSPDGQYISFAGEGQTINIWDFATHTPVCQPIKDDSVPQTRSIWSLAFSLDGKTIVSGSDSPYIRRWSVPTGERVGVDIKGPAENGTRVLSFSPDGREFAAGFGSGEVRRWDAQRGVMVGRSFHASHNEVTALAFAPDGRVIVTGSREGVVRLWDISIGVCASQSTGHKGAVRSVAVSPSGDKVVSGSMDHTIRIWDVSGGVLSRGSLVLSADGRQCVNSVAFSPDGTRIVSGHDVGIIVWDAMSGQSIIPHYTVAETTVRRDDGEEQAEAEPLAGSSPTQSIDEMRTPNDALETRNEYDLFPGWAVQEGWLISDAGEHRLWLPVYMRGFVEEDELGLRIHSSLSFTECNAAKKDHKGIGFVEP